MMKKFLNPIVKLVVKSKFGWSISRLILRFAEWLRYERSLYDKIIAEQNLHFLFIDRKVKSGFFKNLKYKSLVSFGSSLFPKLAGNYESELFEVFIKIEKNNYDYIIDVGCAEGYYAVGLAMKFPNSTIIAFDIEKEARNLTLELAIENSVDQRIEIKEKCTPEWLRNREITNRSFIICDCEGFERYLFDETNIGSLKNSDLIIELHPFIEKDVKEYLTNLFKPSHHIEIITSYDNKRKLFELEQEFNSFSEMERQILVEEGRPFAMDWLIAYAQK